MSNLRHRTSGASARMMVPSLRAAISLRGRYLSRIAQANRPCAVPWLVIVAIPLGRRLGRGPTTPTDDARDELPRVARKAVQSPRIPTQPEIAEASF